MNHGTKKYLGVSVLLLMSVFVAYLGSLSSRLDLPTIPQGDDTRLQVNFIDTHDLKEWLEDGRPFLLVDARWPEEYARGHIPTAVSVHRLGLSNPGYHFPRETAKEGNGQAPVVFYCNGPTVTKSDPCVRAIVRELQRGSQVHWFKGGIKAWREHGYPVVRGS